jgi:Ca2+-transporting ATPase
MTTIPLTSASPYSTRGAVYRNTRSGTTRPVSPPASAYFPSFPDDPHARPIATPNVEAHFAYSTTLRRHHTEFTALQSPAHFAAAVNAEATGLWSRLINTVSGRQELEGELENGRPKYTALEQEGRSDTLSAKFAHYSVQVRVCCWIVDTFHCLIALRSGYCRTF